jgi:hypothetical protein
MEFTEIAEIEESYTARLPDGRNLGDAYDALRERFDCGHRDRETCLRLMFLAWYACSEPPELTGLPDDGTKDVFRAAFEELGGELAADPEVLFTTGLMASMFPYCCGSEAEWSAIGDRLTKRYEAVPAASKLTESVFDGRGAYGKYFAHMLQHRQ